MSGIKRQRTHKFLVKYSFDKYVSRKEALALIRDSGHFGVGANDFYSFDRNVAGYDKFIDGEMKIKGINVKP